MIDKSGLQVAYAVPTLGCKLRCAVIFLLLAYWLSPQCIAAKFHKGWAAGVYLTQDRQLLETIAHHTPGTYWIDGYRMTISEKTLICWHDEPLSLGPTLDWAGQPVSMLKMALPCKDSPPSALGNSARLQYLGNQIYQFIIFEPLMSVDATRIDIWNSNLHSSGESVTHGARIEPVPQIRTGV